MYPRHVELQSPRSLRMMSYALIGGALLFPVGVPDRYGVLAALLMGLFALALMRAAARYRGARIMLLSEARWCAPGDNRPLALAGSSALLAGVFWLHGVDEDGRARTLMLPPDALRAADDYRRLCVWFRLAAAAGD
jgi:hypothetical protein